MPTPHAPGPGQESVWDYPRPPQVDPSNEHVVIAFGGQTIAETMHAVRVLETSHPPTYYLPRDSFAPGTLHEGAGTSFCEFKGVARYLDVRAGGHVASSAAWYVPEPSAGFEQLTGLVALYPAMMDWCEIDGERVVPQPGDFYGGWITSRVVGPFKGEPGTMWW